MARYDRNAEILGTTEMILAAVLRSYNSKECLARSEVVDLLKSFKST